MPQRQLKLTIQLIPRPLWGRSLAKLAPRNEWEKLRIQVFEWYDRRCGICRAGNPTMICHEVWQYDDVNHVQRLADLMLVCEMCNRCIHFGQSERLAAEGKLDLEMVMAHFCSVNGADRFELTMERSRAGKEWNERNKHEWTQDFGEYSDLVP